jgi:mono/diheme cytochrome c family protein
MLKRKLILSFLLAGILFLVIGAWSIISRGFSAREKPHAVEAYVARNLRRFSIPRFAKNTKSPYPVTELSVAEARDHFADHCALCHANDGSGKTEINSGLYPPASDMRGQWVQGLTDGELFYIIKNGIRFTGMPGWGGDDEENWKLVAFIRHLPSISRRELDYMKDINGLETE